MAAIDVQPFLMRDVLLTFKSHVGSATGTGDFEKHVSAVQFVPSSSPVTWKGLGGNSHTYPSVATWVCNITYAQDWETTNSLSQFLHDNEGETIEVDFEPVKGGATVTADIVITPGAIGGTVDSVAEGTVSLGVDGKPTFS